MSEPIIEIETNDGRRLETGRKYARSYDGANAEARELHGLREGEYRLITVGWARDNTGLSGCGDFRFYVD